MAQCCAAAGLIYVVAIFAFNAKILFLPLKVGCEIK